MPEDESENLELERQRLELEREKSDREAHAQERDAAIAEADLELRKADFAVRLAEHKRAGWRNPLVVAILAATTAAVGNAVVTIVNGSLARTIEAQESESVRILEMIKTGGDPDKAAKNLEFLLDAGLIDEPGRIERIRAFLKARKPGSGPSLPAAGIVGATAIKRGEYVDVEVGSFVSLAAFSGQVTQDELNVFVSEALRVLSAPGDYYVDGQRESIQIKGGGEVFIFRTGNETMFRKAQSGVVEVLSAIQQGKDLQGVTITIRGTERFFDINGLSGVGGNAWIGFDLR